MALAHGERRAAVLGCGAVGLTAARQLQRRGFDVTIYAAYVPPDTTSNYSLAGFTPTSGLVDIPKRTPAWEAQFREAVEIAYRQLQFMAGPKYGISWIQNYSPTESAPAASGTNVLLPPHIQGGQTLLQPGEHPFPTTYAIERTEMRIEPNIYLDALMHDFIDFGGRIVIRRFTTPRDVAALPENLIVNCTGLGAKELWGDEELVPLKGLLVILAPQDEVHYSTNGGVDIPPAQRNLFIHMMPRRDGIVLGGTSERGVSTPDISETERNRIVDNHIRLFQTMTPPASGGCPRRRRGDERPDPRRAGPASGLAREMGLLGLTATGICAMVGAAVNVIPFMIQRQVPGIGPNVLPAYLLGAVPAVLAGLVYAMLASAMPRAGGSYVFASRGLSPYLGFVASFSQWFAIAVVMGVVSFLIAPFLRDIAVALEWRGAAAALEHGGVRIAIALAVLWAATALNLLGIRAYERLMVPLMFLTLALGSVVIVAGFSYDQADFMLALQARGDLTLPAMRAVGDRPR